MEENKSNNNWARGGGDLCSAMEITLEEEALMQEFAKRVYDLNEEMRNSETLIRFLRARECDIEKAEVMLRKSAKWFQENDVRSYRAGFTLPQVLADDYICHVLGTDCQGYPVIYVPLGRWNIRDRLKDGYLDATLEGRFYLLEGVIMAAVRQSTRRQQFVLVVDLAELSFYKVAHMDTINVVTQIFQDYEDNYPERLKSAFIINTPWVFPYAFSLVKPWIAAKTLTKVSVLGNRSKWLDTLEVHIPGFSKYIL
ncbi:SEC14-like protein 2 isoform X1 [Folsomia candida]|uniref:SEC14 cytosolic factor n=1 Tax=Folsomia candida TaxID=158441 RepID=A0A226F4V3_FOLCA|nr:SEC14-like protein 2 isoform X1 [Folsomia candida]OXA64813.1 SEC14 cytosolic factor [Folsomia candida]